VECLVNPTLGREKEMEIRPTESPKKVMVIGGGPGGLHAAWVAAVRGHDVQLYEKESRLGGQLIAGSVSTYKKELLGLLEFQIRQVARSGVKTHLSVEVTPDTIKKEKPDVIILSTGSMPIKPRIPGVDQAIVHDIPAVLNGRRPARLRTVVVGGGATGCEVAHHLAENNCPVTIVEQLPKLAPQLESITRKVLLKKLRDFQVRFKTGHR
jgi:NADPH-dependent 2,4-dienoyl-CoA reductase/sulfur reductase-like enzyme